MLADGGRARRFADRGYGGTPGGPDWSMPLPTVPRRSATSRCCSRAWRRPSWRATASPAPSGARARAQASIVMDDGFQNPALAKDFTLRGRRPARHRQRRVFPAGPLRAPLEAQLARTDALLVVGEGNAADGVAARLRARPAVFHGRLEPDRRRSPRSAAQSVLAFAGIGDPEKFFATARAGRDRCASRRRTFPTITATRRRTPRTDLRGRARRHSTLLTTEKDRARMDGDAAPRGARRARAGTLPVDDGQFKKPVICVGCVKSERPRLAPIASARARSCVSAAAPPPATHRPPAVRRSSI